MSIFSNTPFDPSTWNPSTWFTPTDVPSTFDDPSYTENRYQIGFANESRYTIILRCITFSSRSGLPWGGDWRNFWTLHPGENQLLFYDAATQFNGNGPVVGNFFRFAGLSTDNTVHWGSPQDPHVTAVGRHYNTTGGFEPYYEPMRGPA